MPYERPNIAAMAGYTPGEQPTAARLVKLNTNENPYPPCDAVMAVLRDFPAERLRKYPPPLATGFRELAARTHSLKAENVIATNGGDELLRLLIATFVEPGRPVAMAEPSYSLYPVLAAAHGSPMVRIALTDGRENPWSLPADFARQVLDARASLVFVVNPHAPSGTLTPVAALADVAAALRGKAVLVVDEAYVDFVDPALNHDAATLVRQFDNVVLLRTLSKGYSLAGLRFGYGLGPVGLIEPMLTKTRDSYNTDALAQALAVAALDNRDAAAATWACVRDERARLRAALARRGFQSPPSQSNFLLAAAPRGEAQARAVFESLKTQGVFVRYFDQDRLRDKLRITIGAPAENDALLAALDVACDARPAAAADS